MDRRPVCLSKWRKMSLETQEDQMVLLLRVMARVFNFFQAVPLCYCLEHEHGSSIDSGHDGAVRKLLLESRWLKLDRQRQRREDKDR